MASQTSPIEAVGRSVSDARNKHRRRWGIWFVAITILVIISGLALAAISCNHTYRLVQAANQIQIGSEWKQVCDENKEFWSKPFFSISLGPGKSEEFVYGGPANRVLSDISWAMYTSKYNPRGVHWFNIRSQCPVGVEVDQNGTGKVVGVRVRNSWRRESPPPMIGSAKSE